MVETIFGSGKQLDALQMAAREESGKLSCVENRGAVRGPGRASLTA